MLTQMPGLTGNDKEDLTSLYDYVVALRRELYDILYNLDDDNMGQITAASIKTDTLIVGQNIQMGEGAYISWGQVTGVPSDIVYQSVLANYPTQTQLATALSGYTTNTALANALAGYITTGELSDALTDYMTEGRFDTLIGQNYIVTGLVAANRIAAGEIAGVTVKTASSTNYIHMQEQMVDFWRSNLKKMEMGFATVPGTPFIKMGAGDGSGANEFVISKGTSSATLEFWSSDGGRNAIEFINNGDMIFIGDVNFNQATVTGLNVVAKFA